MTRLSILVLILGGMAGCTSFPELENTVPDDVVDAKYPTLVPLGPLLEGTSETAATNTEIEQSLLARVAALQARAASLQRPVIDRKTRTRMRRGVDVR